MSDQIPQGSTDQAQTQVPGTTQAGQPSQSAGAQPNDPQSFQADYTKKYQALADDRRALEAEKAALAQERQRAQAYQNNGYSQAQRPAQGFNPGYTQVNPNQALIDQFGYEGAQAILQTQQTQFQQISQSQFDLAYTLEEQKGKAQFGEEGWKKHDYFDPVTGKTRNKVMDYRLALNPVTGQSLSLQEAWNAVNPVNTTEFEQKIRDAVYAELNSKQQATAASASTSVPSSSGRGHATSIEEALNQAAATVGWSGGN